MIDDTITTRERLSALALVAAPLVLGAGLVLHPEEVTRESSQLDIVRRHASAWGTAHLLIYLGSVLMVGAVIALVRLAERHHGRGALAAGVVAAFGAIALAATATTEMVTRHVVQAVSDPTTQAVVYHGYEKAGDLSVAVFLPELALTIGLLGMMVVLLRARAVAPWAAVAIGLGGLLAPIPVVALRDVGAVVLLAGMAAAAAALARTPGRSTVATRAFAVN